MAQQSRRRLLGTVAGATTVLAAGCLDALPLIGDDAELPAFSEWLPDDDIESVTYAEVAALEEWPEAVQADLGIDHLLEHVPIDGVEAIILIEGPIGPMQVFTGSFDPESASADLGLPEEPDDERGAYLQYGTTAVGPDAVIFGSELEAVIDAKRGETARLADENETWHDALASVHDTPFAAITMAEGTLAALDREGVTHRALGLERTNGEFAVTVRLFYEDADAASADVENLEADLADEALIDDASVEQDGDVLVVEGSVDT